MMLEFWNSRWLWMQLKHWMKRMVQTNQPYQGTLSPHMGTCLLATQHSSQTTSTTWKTVESLFSIRTTTLSRTQMRLLGGGVAGRQSQRTKCHRPSTRVPRGLGVAHLRTQMRLCFQSRPRCLQSCPRWRPHQVVGSREDGQGRWRGLVEDWEEQRQQQSQQQQLLESLGVALQRWRIQWLKWVLNNRLLFNGCSGVWRLYVFLCRIGLVLVLVLWCFIM